MPRKPKKSPPEALAPVAPEILDQFVRDGSLTTADAAAAALEAFAAGPWGRRFPPIIASWRRAWPQVIPCFAFPPAVRRVIYTTHALESVHARLRKILETRGHFPTDEAATKLIWLALRNITRDWARPVFHWRAAMTQCAILDEDRFTSQV